MQCFVAALLTQHGALVEPIDPEGLEVLAPCLGRITLYRWGDALAWAESRLSPPRCSSSEADAQQRT
jgi:hypothetical protein